MRVVDLTEHDRGRPLQNPLDADISPDVTPFQLRSGRSSYVHDPLFVRAIALESGQGRVVIATVDAIGVGREMADEARRRSIFM